MKICPRCQKTYSDQSLNFCLDDGAILTQSNAVDNSIPPTVMMNQARPTSPPQQFGSQSAMPPNQFSMQPPPAKKSKAWLWVVGIIGGLMLLCGTGFIGLVFYGASLENSNSNRSIAANSSNFGTNIANKNKNTLTDGSSVQKIDLSKWVQEENDLGTTEYADGELLMGSKNKGYYYVLAAQSIYKTENATTRVTAKNVNEGSTRLGFGLIIHSNPTPLVQDYAFLIDSENKKYRIVRHSPGVETVVVGWTRSPAVNGGSETNTLAVYDSDKTMKFYINGELVKTVSNTDGYSGGVTGLYAGDAVQIAFSDLEITR